MKKIILLGLAFFTAGNCISAEFHRGGVTFPLEQFARRAEAHTRDTGKNLFRNSDFSAPLVTWKQPDTGWYNTIWIAGQGNMAKYLKATENIASGRIVETDRGKALELLRPLELENRMGEDVTLFTTSFNQTVRLPDENGGLYVLSFDNRTQCIGDKRYAQMLLFTCRDGSSPIPGRGKVLKGYNIRIMADPQWHSFRHEFNVPPGTRDVSVSIRADGCGGDTTQAPAVVCAHGQTAAAGIPNTDSLFSTARPDKQLRRGCKYRLPPSRVLRRTDGSDSAPHKRCEMPQKKPARRGRRVRKYQVRRSGRPG